MPSSPPELLLLATHTSSDNSSYGGELGMKLGFASTIYFGLCRSHDCLTTPTLNNTYLNYAIVIHACHMTLTTPTLDIFLPYQSHCLIFPHISTIQV